MLRNTLSRIGLRTALVCTGALVPYACARGIDVPLEPEMTGGGGDNSTVGTAGVPVTMGTGGSTTSSTTGAGGSATGAGGTTSTAAGGSSTTMGSGGTGNATGGAGGSSGAGGGAGASGAGGAAGNGGGGAGGGGKAGNGGAGGTVGTGGNGGAGGQGGTPLRPTGITLGANAPTALQAPSATGGAFNAVCAANEVLIGFSGTVDPPDSGMNWLKNIQGICGKLSISGTATFSVNTAMAETLPLAGIGMGSTTQTRMCAANQVVIAFKGHSGGYIDELSFVCAPLNISGTSPNFTLSIGAASAALATLGGPGGSPFAQINCPANQIAVGQTGRSGTFIDAFGLLCAAPTLVVQ
jgi:hypothetical protein